MNTNVKGWQRHTRCHPFWAGRHLLFLQFLQVLIQSFKLLLQMTPVVLQPFQFFLFGNESPLETTFIAATVITGYYFFYNNGMTAIHSILLGLMFLRLHYGCFNLFKHLTQCLNTYVKKLFLKPRNTILYFFQLCFQTAFIFLQFI